jgi:dipeptidyl aminopeptidase/acylaminoacyl peptidase
MAIRPRSWNRHAPEVVSETGGRRRITMGPDRLLRSQIATRTLILAFLTGCSGGGRAAPSAPLPKSSASPTAASPAASGPVIDIASLAGHIVFSAGSARAEDVYLVDADGSGLTQLTRSPDSDFDPALSPDGKQIVYRHQDGVDPTAEVYVMNADGSQPHDVSNEDNADWGPSWSPDGMNVLWNCQRDLSRGFRACFAHPDGTGVEVIPADIWVEYPAWSPDGTRIAFMAQEPTASGDDPDYNIYVMNTDGTGLARLTDAPGSDGFPSWSPDGTRIAFSTTRDDCRNADAADCLSSGDIGPYHSLYVMNADGSDQNRITTQFAMFTDWSPDGSYLVFSPGLNVIRPDGTGLTSIPVTGLGTDIEFADWGT